MNMRWRVRKHDGPRMFAGKTETAAKDDLRIPYESWDPEQF
jgi:hypothetical protein